LNNRLPISGIGGFFAQPICLDLQISLMPIASLQADMIFFEQTVSFFKIRKNATIFVARISW